MTLFAVEGLDESRRRRLVTIRGVDYSATSRSWLNPPLLGVVGVVVALIIGPADPLPRQLAVGVGYGSLIFASSFCHGLGHILSSRIVNSPMKSLLFTATVHITHYEDDEGPGREHVGRALGGPLLNLLLGLTVIAIFTLALDNHFVLFFATVNLLFGAMTLLPIPSLDGAVFLRELKKLRASRVGHQGTEA